MVKSPYNEYDLKLALLGINESLLTDDLINELNSISNVKDNVSLQKKVAEYNGIDIITLINSPNYLILVEMYKDNIFKKSLELLESKGFKNDEAWAILVMATGNLKI